VSYFIFIAGYVLIGLATWGLVCGRKPKGQRANDPGNDHDRTLMIRALGASRSQLAERLFSAALCLLVIFAWPILLVVLLKRWRSSSPDQPATDGSRFVVLPEYLIASLDIQEIEERETPSDPFGAVPSLPFGHLYVNWHVFRAGLDEKDEVWSFLGGWTEVPGCILQCAGYVAVRDGAPGRFVLTEYFPIY
jgi:hypothetical protein